MKKRSSASLFAAAALGFSIVCVSAPAQEDKPVQMDKVVVSEVKTHSLFMGADVSVGINGENYPVRGVSGSSWVVDMNGQKRMIPFKEETLKVKVTPSLKLTESFATVANLKDEHGYTFGNDPSTRLTKALSQTGIESGDYHAAQNQAIASQNQAMAATQMRINLNDAQGGASPAARRPVVQQTLNSAQQDLTLTSDEIGSDQTIGRNHPLSDGFDAMEVNFEVSSKSALREPYVITMTRFHPKDTKQGTVQILIYAKSLDPIDAHPAEIHFLEGGFPVDFDVIGFQLHLYNAGEEIATSVSSRRVALTRDEAFEYLKLEYLGAHKGETLPATPAMGKLPADLAARLAAGKYGGTYYVVVSKDGLAKGPYSDTACTMAVGDPYLESVVKNIRFKPALDQGKVVEGTAALNLNRLTI